MLDYIEPAPAGHQNPNARAVQKTLWPEFVNSRDVAVTVSESLDTVLDDNIKALQQHVTSRLGDRCFMIEVLPEAREFLLEYGAGYELGPRELKRALHRQLTQPLETKVARGEIQPDKRATKSWRPATAKRPFVCAVCMPSQFISCSPTW